MQMYFDMDGEVDEKQRIESRLDSEAEGATNRALVVIATALGKMVILLMNMAIVLETVATMMLL